MKIYIVTSGEYSDYSIDRVFFDKKKAEIFSKYNTRPIAESRVEEYDVDETYTQPEDTYISVFMQFEIYKKDGDTFYKSRNTYSYFEYTDNKDEFKDSNYYYDCSRYNSSSKLGIRRVYKEKDYTENEAMHKVEKIGYDLCAKIINMLNEGADEDDIKKVIEYEGI